MTKFAVIIIETSKDADGGYIPVVVTEGETGYRPLSGKGECSAPWNWGKDKDIAEEMARDYNAKLGITEEEAERLTIQSFGTQPNYDTRLLAELIQTYDPGELMNIQVLFGQNDYNGVIMTVAQIDDITSEVELKDVDWEEVRRLVFE